MVCLQTITRFEIASMVPVDGESSFAEIAGRIDGLSERMVCRLLRHAMALHVFREPTRGMVAHTKASRALVDPTMNAWLRNGTHEMWPAAVKVCVMMFMRSPGCRRDLDIFVVPLIDCMTSLRPVPSGSL